MSTLCTAGVRRGHSQEDISARLALVKGMHEEEETVYSNYKKFSTDSRDRGY